MPLARETDFMPRHFANCCPATLGDMAAQGLDIWCWCNSCFHYAVLDTAMLKRKLGADQSVLSVAEPVFRRRINVKSPPSSPVS